MPARATPSVRKKERENGRRSEKESADEQNGRPPLNEWLCRPRSFVADIIRCELDRCGISQLSIIPDRNFRRKEPVAGLGFPSSTRATLPAHSPSSSSSSSTSTSGRARARAAAINFSASRAPARRNAATTRSHAHLQRCRTRRPPPTAMSRSGRSRSL